MSVLERLLSPADRKSILSVAITVSLLVSLVAFAAPSAAVSTTLTGSDEVGQAERVTITGTVDIETDERVPVEGFVLEFSPRDDGDESVAITFAPDGTVLNVTPDRGVNGEGEIRVNRLERTLEIEPVAVNAPYGYGARTGYDRTEDRTREFGYGYGYADGSQTEFRYEITFDTRAFKQGEYASQLSVDTGSGTAFASEPFDFEVTVPANDRGRPDTDANDGNGDDEGRDAPDSANGGPDRGDDGTDRGQDETVRGQNADDGAETPGMADGMGDSTDGDDSPERQSWLPWTGGWFSFLFDAFWKSFAALTATVHATVGPVFGSAVFEGLL